jgi:hypothetical protein
MSRLCCLRGLDPSTLTIASPPYILQYVFPDPGLQPVCFKVDIFARRAEDRSHRKLLLPHPSAPPSAIPSYPQRPPSPAHQPTDASNPFIFSQPTRNRGQHRQRRTREYTIPYQNTTRTDEHLSRQDGVRAGTRRQGARPSGINVMWLVSAQTNTHGAGACGGRGRGSGAQRGGLRHDGQRKNARRRPAQTCRDVGRGKTGRRERNVALTNDGGK